MPSQDDLYHLKIFIKESTTMKNSINSNLQQIGINRATNRQDKNHRVRASQLGLTEGLRGI
jgi:hypothetical protein